MCELPDDVRDFDTLDSVGNTTADYRKGFCYWFICSYCTCFSHPILQW